MSLHVKDLPDFPGAGVHLRCVHCDGKFSAMRSDYFAADPDTELEHCSYDMVLAREIVTYEVIGLGEAEGHKEDG